MPFTGSTYALTSNSAYPAVPSTDIVSADHNAVLQDIQDSINAVISCTWSGYFTRLPVGDAGNSNWSISAKTSTSDSTKFPLVLKNSSGTMLANVRADGPAFLNGPVLIAPESYWGSSAPAGTTRQLYVACKDTSTVADTTTGHTAIEARMDYQPTGNTSANPDGIYGTLWYNAPYNFTGNGAAIRGNAYTIAQNGGAAVNVSLLIGAYGRPRHEAAGTVTNAISIMADAAQNAGTGTITNAMGLYITSQTAATNNYGLYLENQPSSGSVAAAANIDLKYAVTGTGTHKFTTAGGTVNINAAGQITNTVQGNIFGQASGSSSSPSADTTNVLLFKNSATSYAGWACDTSGNPYLVSGTSSPATRMSFDVNSGALRLHGYGAGTLTTDASGNVTATSDIDYKFMAGAFTKGGETLRRLRRGAWKWKPESGNETDGTYHGFIIDDEFEKALPEAVGRNPDGSRSLIDRPVMAVMANTIESLLDEVAILRAELAEIRKGG